MDINIRLVETSIGIINKHTDEEGWAKISLDLSAIIAIRPAINEDSKYEGTVVYFTSGIDLLVQMEYKDLNDRWKNYLEHVL